MGPFRSKAIRFLIRTFLPHVDLIVVRGKESRKHLEDLGIWKKKDVHVCPDLAFLFQASPKKRALEILEEHKINISSGSLVGIVPNIRVYERSFSEHGNKYVEALRNFIDFIIEKFDATIVLLPYWFREDYPDDRVVIREITKDLKSKDRVYTINEDFSSADLKAVIGQMDLLIASRFHSVVAGLSMRVPTMVIGWTHKYKELMDMIGQGEFLVDYQNLDLDETKEKLTRLWTTRYDIKQILEDKVSRLEKDAEKPVILLKALLESYGKRLPLLEVMQAVKNLLVLMLVCWKP